MKGWERKQVLGAGGEGGGGWAQPGWVQATHSPLTGQAHTRGCTHTHNPVLPLHLKETAMRQHSLT